jgi:phospholipase C
MRYNGRRMTSSRLAPGAFALAAFGFAALALSALLGGCQLPPSSAFAVDVGTPAEPVDAAARDAADIPMDAETEGPAVGQDAAAGSPFSTGVCPTPVPVDPKSVRRAACAFGKSATPIETLPLTAEQRAAIPIKHIIVVMKENRSFDHLLGGLHASGQPAAEEIPASFTNPDSDGVAVAPFHLETTCVNRDPGHQWDEMHRQVNHGAMDGFVVSAADTTAGDGHFAMGTYAATDLPFYYWLASTYALNERHFPSVLSGTFSNRTFLLFGTADGVSCSFCGKMAKPSTPSIFNSLDRAGVGWGVYTDSGPFDGTLDWKPGHRGLHSFADFHTALAAGTLPAVSFVDSIGWVEDEHPTADVQVGEAWTRLVYEAVVASPLWPSTAMIWTYDEAGGFADHVPPPMNACIARPGNPDDAPYFELGIRVPLAVISPWARAHYVSDVVEDHTAITRFIETVFDLPALTARDANSPALLDLFDFGCSPALLHPPEAPLPGVEGCHGVIVLTGDLPSYRSAPPQVITVAFKGVPSPDAADRIAVYRYPRASSDVPSEINRIEPAAWGYIGGGGRVMGDAPTSGKVVLDESVRSPGALWPLPPGLWIAHYLAAPQHGVAGYEPVASTLIQVTP